MKKSFSLVFIILLLLISSSFVFANNIDDILLNGEVFIIDEGTIYVSVEKSVYERDNFSTKLMFIQKDKDFLTGNISLERNGELIKANIFADDLENNDTYILFTWVDAIIDDSNYEILFTINDKELMKKTFSVKTIPKTIIDRTYETIPTNEGQIDGDENILELILNADLEYSEKQFVEEQIIAEESVNLKKTINKETVYFIDNTSTVYSTVHIQIDPKTTLEKINIIEIIPKDIAYSADEIIFKNEVIILENDPVIMWHLENIDEEQEITYTVEKNLKTTGNTVLLAKTAEQVNKSSGKGFLAFILIPLVAIIIIYFSKFSPNTKKKK